MWLHFEGKSHDLLLKNTHVLEQEKGPEDARREGRCFIMCTLAWWGKLDKGPQEGPPHARSCTGFSAGEYSPSFEPRMRQRVLFKFETCDVLDTANYF